MKKLTRAVLSGLQLEPLHVARNGTKADVYRFEWPRESGRYAVLKDMSVRGAWFRLIAGRIFIWREYRALRALEGIEGIPRAIAQLDADSFVMEWRPGKPIMKWEKDKVTVEILDGLAHIVEQAHARGIIHGDLHRSNILISEEGTTTVIDWATAGVFGNKRSGLKAFTFKEWCSLDRRAVAKLKARHAPHSLTAEELELLNGSKMYRLIRTAGFRIRRMFGHRNTHSPEMAIARYKDLAGVGTSQPHSEREKKT
jgi:tRNA A-37 threonylcarbamoyl transferase component Bud32